MVSVRKIVIIFSLLFLGGYVYKQILPRYFPLQYQPTTADINLSGYYDPSEPEGIWHGQKALSYKIPAPNIPGHVLGDSNAQKRIEVDLTNQRLYAFEGGTKVYDFPISSGKWGRTPTGTFSIWIKLRYTKMEGGSRALNTYYYLPNVPYVMYFANDQIPRWRGYGLHGTYWHNNFGHPMSHGCINLRTEDAEKLYYWTQPHLNGKASISATEENPGTQIIIYGEAPWE